MVYNLIKLYGENSLQSSYADTVGITTFNSTEQQGFITYLPDATSATVTEEINGQFDLVMNYPVTGDGYKDILVNRIIACKPNPHSSIQAFRIYKISKPIDGIIEVTANHISYDLNGYILNPFTVTNKTPDEVIKAFKSHSTTTCPFSFSSDVNKTVSKFAVSKPISIREMLGGNLSNELSLIQTCSGEFEFDNLKVSLKQARGSDNGVRISYGKNLTEFKYDEDSSPFYTGVYPYWSTTKKPDNDSSSTVVTPTVSNQQTFEATAQYGNMNLVLSVTKGSTSGSNTSLSWSLYFKIVVVGGYHFNYQNSCEVYINGAKVFSSANVKAIDINGLAVGATVQLASGTATVPSSKVSVPVSATFIQRQDTRGTWKISGNYAMTGGTEVVTNVATNDIYYTVTLDGTKTHDYDTSVKFKKLYTLDLSKEIEQAKNNKGELIYPGVTPAQLNTAFQKYLSENDPPTINTDSLEVSFVDLAQSDEYADYAGLETVNIGDIVTVDFSAYNVSKTKECVKTEYDVLSDSYITLTLGELTDTLASTIQNGASLAQRNTVNAEQLANSVNANFNSIQVLNLTASTIQADYVVVNERLTATEASIGSLTADYGSFKSATVGSLSAQYASISNLYVDYGSFKSATVSSLTAQYASISSLTADYGSFKSATVSSLTAQYASISNLTADYGSFKSATVSSLTAQYASISNLTADYGSFKSATVSSLTAQYASISNLTADYGSFKTATIASLSATNASIRNLSTVYATIENLSATNAAIENLSTVYATIENLSATNAAITNLSTVYADIDFANISIANVESLFAKTGIISDLTVQSGHLTGELQFVTLNGDLIEVGTLVADRIVMVGENGLYYQLNTNGMSVTANQTDYNSLNGTNIQAQTITADKIYVSDLYAFNATIGTLQIDSGSIHTVSKDSVTAGTTGIFISPTSFAIGNATKHLTYNADGNQTLELTGKIVADEGSIAGWEIRDTFIRKDVTYGAGTDWAGDQYSAVVNSMAERFYTVSTNWPHGRDPGDIDAFAVAATPSGEQGSYPFRVRYDGTLVATKAHIIGEITATSLTLGNGVTLAASKVSGLASVATSGSYNDLSSTPDMSIYIYKDGTVGNTPAEGATGFKVASTGKLEASSAIIYGELYSSKGTIAGWTIDSNVISKETDGTNISESNPQYKACMQAPANPGAANRAFYLRHRTSSSGSWSDDFAVFYDGSMIANKATIKGASNIAGWTVDDTSIFKEKANLTINSVTYAETQAGLFAPSSPTTGNRAFFIRRKVNSSDSSYLYPFLVTYGGELTATSATITGTVTANSGYIGGTTGWVITTGKIYKGTAGSASGIFLDATAGTTATVAGASHANLMIGVGANFGVDKNGCLYATNVSLSGVITATSGTFTGTVNATGGYFGQTAGNRMVISSSGLDLYSGTTYGGRMTFGSNSVTITATSIVLTGLITNLKAYNTLLSAGRTMRVNDEGTIGYQSSSERFKYDIYQLDYSKNDPFAGLIDLPVKHFKYKNDPDSDRIGFIAEDVAKIFPEAAYINPDGTVDGWDETVMTIGTFALLQRLYKRVDELERKLATYDK